MIPLFGNWKPPQAPSRVPDLHFENHCYTALAPFPIFTLCNLSLIKLSPKLLHYFIFNEENVGSVSQQTKLRGSDLA